jgi:DNA-binding NtrC family response regulator
MAKLLIVDDDRNIRETLANFFRTLGHQVKVVESGAQALTAFTEEGNFELILSDCRMDKMDGLELLGRVKQSGLRIPFILMTAYGTVESAIEAMKLGALDYVIKPFSLEKIQDVVHRALDVRNLPSETRTAAADPEDEPMLAPLSPVMRSLIITLRQAAASDAAILLLGETGTGKSVLARQIHRWSERSEGPFVVVNCTNTSEQLSESELFGHVRGAFTGALHDRRGRLEAADNGTLFLDEVAALSPRLQAKFLRFAQEHSFERIGSDKTIWLDTRIVAASNHDLAAEVRAGRFREGLFYRLNVVSFEVPPLRKRLEDILPTAQFFASAAGVRNHRPLLHFSPDAASAILCYTWPGNIRELRNVVERAAILATDDTIGVDCLPAILFADPSELPSPEAHGQPAMHAEKERIRRVVNRTRMRKIVDESRAGLAGRSWSP